MFWNVGTLLGALAGSAIDPQTYGLDAAFPAAYVAMLWPLLRDRRARLTAACGAVICLVLIPFAARSASRSCAASLAILRRSAAMTWTLIILLAVGAYAFKVLGLVVIGDGHCRRCWSAASR